MKAVKASLVSGFRERLAPRWRGPPADGARRLLGPASIVLLALGGVTVGLDTARGQATPTIDPVQVRQAALGAGLASLGTVRVPDAPTFKQFVANRSKLLILGKALFWEQQVGSDGQACASCHFHAGADSRSRNQLNPGFRNTTPGVDTFAFNDPTGFGPNRNQFGPNHQLTIQDFPFHRVSNPDVNPELAPAMSSVVSDTNDVASSQGVFNAGFLAFGIPGDVGHLSLTGFGAVFNVGGVLFRNVEPRNTPTVINAALNHRNFWDGRARNEFNGIDPIGALDPTARVVKAVPVPGGSHGVFVQIRQTSSSAASQADGPPLSDLEMSFAGRLFATVGRKMLQPGLQALGGQLVDPSDGVLGPFSCAASANLGHPGCTNGPNGITLTYGDLIQGAFQPTWTTLPGWIVDYTCANRGPAVGCPVLTTGVPDGANPGLAFSIMEYNFPLYFGTAVQEYEKTLISDQTRFDRFMGGDATALTDPELRGLTVFTGQGRCSRCHGGPELTNASLGNVQRFELLERMIMGNDRIAVYDNGFYNIGVRPTLEDLGVGARIGPRDLPLSSTRFFQECVQQQVPSLQAANPGLTSDQIVRLANARCDVPRILARPAEAAVLLARIAAGVSDPVAQATARALLAQAEADLALAPLGVPGAVALLLQVETLLAAAGGDATLLAEARKLLPDPVDPGPDPLKPFGPPLGPDERVAVDGALKVPGLRNVAFTAPYFHNGGAATLEQVVEFYDRGGNFPRTNQENLDPDIQPLGLTAGQKADLVQFLRALSTDPRVAFELAPFDHPSLGIPNGGSTVTRTDPATGVRFQDDRVTVPAVGAAGNGVGYGVASTPFADFLQPLQ